MGLIHDAYEIIGGLTPVKNGDCGKLCGKICCDGDKAGMLLFPGEENILKDVPGFSVEEIEYMDIPGIKLLMCGGECDRDLRPFACRIFPAAPNIDVITGNVTASPDIRGRRMCPLWDLEHVDKNFIKAVKKAFELLAKDGEAMFLMRLISDDLHDISLP